MHALYSFTLEVTEQHKMLRLISFRQQVPTYPKIIAGKPYYRIQSRFVWKFSWGQGFQRRSSLILSSKERNHADGREGLCLPSLFLLWAFSRPGPSVATKCKTLKGFPLWLAAILGWLSHKPNAYTLPFFHLSASRGACRVFRTVLQQKSLLRFNISATYQTERCLNNL